MPAGVPVGTLAIGTAGAVNAALLAAAIVALHRPDVAERLARYRHDQTAAVLGHPDPREAPMQEGADVTPALAPRSLV